MKFDDLDAKMRVFETAHDHCVLPGIHIVVRLDGRGFTRFTKDVMAFEAPFDVRFRDVMVAVVQHLMECGVRAVFGYTQSDEISLLLHRDDSSFARKERKLNSILAGEASGVASLRFGRPVAFDARVCQLPTEALVVDYFRWRQEDAKRNALDAHCYWALRGEGVEPKAAAERIAGRSIAEKNEFLFRRGTNFNDLPAWQKRGVGVRWSRVVVEGVDPRDGRRVAAERRRLAVDTELPFGDDYSGYVRAALGDAAT